MQPLTYTKPNPFRAAAVIGKFFVTAPLLTLGLAMLAWDIVRGHR